VLIEDRDTEASIHIDFVPMADVLFNLLIFFLLATTIAQVEREMRIALPFASSSEPISAQLRELVVNVDAQGRIHVAGRQMQTEELGTMVREAVAVNPEQKVTVRGDRTTAYSNVVAVLDICKSSGIQEPYLDTVLEN
jgi:biopolymer transport protein ExbD